jgi:hypothetical protein
MGAQNMDSLKVAATKQNKTEHLARTWSALLGKFYKIIAPKQKKT